MPRQCEVCGVTDTEPKHQLWHTADGPVFHHRACGPQMNPPCGTEHPAMRACLDTNWRD